MYNNMKCPILKPYLKIWHWRKLFTGGTSLHGPSSFADTCPCTNTSCRSFNTTLNTSDSVIFISKVLIILMRDFGPCFTSNGERAHVRCIHSVRHFCNGIPTPEMIFMNISEWCIRSCKLQNSQLPMRRCAILCWQISAAFSDDTVLNLNEKIFFLKIK